MDNFKHIEKSNSNYDITVQSFGLVLQFIHHIIQLKQEDFIILYPKIIPHILHWVQAQSFNLQQQTWSILQTIIMNVRLYNNSMNQNLQCDISEKLIEILNVSKMYKLKSSDNVKMYKKN